VGGRTGTTDGADGGGETQAFASSFLFFFFWDAELYGQRWAGQKEPTHKDLVD
jgi:hypothetical protein